MLVSSKEVIESEYFIATQDLLASEGHTAHSGQIGDMQEPLGAIGKDFVFPIERKDAHTAPSFFYLALDADVIPGAVAVILCP